MQLKLLTNEWHSFHFSLAKFKTELDKQRNGRNQIETQIRANENQLNDLKNDVNKIHEKISLVKKFADKQKRQEAELNQLRAKEFGKETRVDSKVK